MKRTGTTTRQMKVLLTGFKPRPGRLSPSMLVVNRLHGREIGGLRVVGKELPEDFTLIPGLIERLVEEEEPGVAISLGWDNQPWVKLDKIALNVMSAHVGDKVVPDHGGHAPEERVIVEGGPVAYASTLPTSQIVVAVRKSGIPAFPSYSVGTHVRNAAMYSLIHWTAVRGEGIAGQVHVPPLHGMFGPEQPTMSLEDEARAVRLAIEESARFLRHSTRGTYNSSRSIIKSGERQKGGVVDSENRPTTVRRPRPWI